jgi:arylsulfatase A-like enzyme
MNVLLLSIDSLRRDFLSAYRDTPRCVDYDVETDNLDRFAETAITFDNHYAGSLPCMPARREWLAGVQEFLWRPWGPMEAYDDPLPELARASGALTHLITDHFHYFQHGSHGYYEDFNGFDFLRGHEYDAWRTAPRDPDDRLYRQSADPETDPPHGVGYVNRTNYARNAEALGMDDTEADEENFFGPRVLSRTADWVGDHDDWDQWFCYVDSFDVHEPFHCPEPYASMYTGEDPTDPDLPFWPYYGPIDEGQSELSERELDFVRAQFAGKVTMVDRWFGRVVDALDEGDRWDDTMVIVTSDHGFFLGDHGWTGKNEPPCYDVLANTPLMVWHPDSPRTGERVDALTAAVDLYATVLDGLDTDAPEDTHSRSLAPVIRGDAEDHRDYALYGYWGSSVNVTDGRYTYMHPCDPDEPTDCFSTEMMNARQFAVPRQPKPDAEAGEFLPYTDSPVWRYDAPSTQQNESPLLFDTEADPGQTENIAAETEAGADEDGAGGDDGATDQMERMRSLLVDALDDYGAPDSQYERLGLD